MEREASSFASSNISLVDSILEDWDTLDEISLKQEVEYSDIVDKSSKEEKNHLIINLEDSSHDISDSTPSEGGGELSEILLENDQGCRIYKVTTEVNSIKNEESIETEKKIGQETHGTCEILFMDLQRENLQQLQKQKHFNGIQSALRSSETKLKKMFERRLDKRSGKVLFKCLHCQFQSIYLKDMIGHISNKHQNGSEMVECDRRSYPKMEAQEGICGLCLKVCDNFKAIDDDMKDVLDVVLPKIDLGAIQKLVVCTHCTEMLIKCSAFKTKCLNAYDCIVSFANYRDDVKLNLRDVYLSKHENGTVVAEDQDICGFCMDPIRNYSAISLNVEEKSVLLEKMMEQCLPELVLSLIEKLVICAPCHDSLKNCFHFVTNCLGVGEKIKKCYETQDINSRGQIELSRLLEFTARDVTTSEVNGNLVDAIKEEKQFYEKKENADERVIDNRGDIFKFQQITCTDGENAAEECKAFNVIEIQEAFCRENETYLKEENRFEMDNLEFLDSKEDPGMKTDEPDFIRFEEGLDLPPSEVTTINCKLHNCDFCSYQTREKGLLKKHELIHKNPLDLTMYKCSFCPYQTKWKHYLIKYHSLKHKDLSEVTVYKCDFCPYHSRKKSHILTHLLRHKDPSEVTMFTCDTCPYQSKYKGDLKKHIRAHKKNGPSEVTVYKCDLCSYQTRLKGYLKSHLLVHKKESPSKLTVYKYKCDFCRYRARTKAQIAKHLPRHKSPSEVTMYTCYTCLYQSKYKGDLKKHILAHKKKDPSKATAYKCNFCPYQAKRKDSLKTHLLTHNCLSEVTVYKCDFCPYRTRSKYTLQTHLLKHKDPSEITMYTCDTCTYQSRYKGDLTKHLLVHEKERHSEVTSEM